MTFQAERFVRGRVDTEGCGDSGRTDSEDGGGQLGADQVAERGQQGRGNAPVVLHIGTRPGERNRKVQHFLQSRFVS